MLANAFCRHWCEYYAVNSYLMVKTKLKQKTSLYFVSFVCLLVCLFVLVLFLSFFMLLLLLFFLQNNCTNSHAKRWFLLPVSDKNGHSKLITVRREQHGCDVTHP